MADSEGHSAPATVMMAMTCALFRSCPDLHDQPEKVLDFINTMQDLEAFSGGRPADDDQTLMMAFIE